MRDPIVWVGVAEFLRLVRADGSRECDYKRRENKISLEKVPKTVASILQVNTIHSASQTYAYPITFPSCNKTINSLKVTVAFNLAGTPTFLALSETQTHTVLNQCTHSTVTLKLCIQLICSNFKIKNKLSPTKPNSKSL